MKKIMLYFSALDVFQEPDEKLVKAILEASIDAIEFCKKFAEEKGFEVTDVYALLPLKDEVLRGLSGYRKYQTVDYHDMYMKAFEKALETVDVVVIIPALKRGSGIPKEEKELCFKNLVNVRDWDDMFYGGQEFRDHIKQYIHNIRTKKTKSEKPKVKDEHKKEQEIVHERIRVKTHVNYQHR